MATLRLIPASGSPIEVSKDLIMVGRDVGCDVVLSDGSVSRRHARIEKRGDDWAVVDQASANGTYIDSNRITDAPLRNGHELRLGSVSVRVEITGADDLNETIGGVAATMLQQAAPVLPPPVAPPPPPPPPTRPDSPVPPGLRASPPPPPPPPPAAPPRSSVPPPPPSSRGAVSPVGPIDGGAAPPPKKGKGPFFWALTGCFGCLTAVLLLCALVAGAIYFGTKGPNDLVKQFLEDVRQGKVDEAYSRLSSDYQARLSRRAFEAALEEHPALKDNVESHSLLRSGSLSVTNGIGVVRRPLVSPSGQGETATIRLVKESGGWKISSIALDGRELGSGSALFEGSGEPDTSQ